MRLFSGRVRWLPLLLVFALAGLPASPQESTGKEPEGCRRVQFAGEVGKGQPFEREVESKFWFRLRPERHPQNPQGWTIEIRSRANPENDYVWVATPPYRFSNPRYLDTGYGLSARQAVEWSSRTFSFVVTDSDYQELSETVTALLWPGQTSGEEQEKIRGRWKEILETRTGHGRLRVLHSQLASAGPEDEIGWIESLKFEVELCVPAFAAEDEKEQE